MGSTSRDILVNEAMNFYDTSDDKVKRLTRRFFESMDANNNGRVDLKEIQSFLQYGNFNIGPYDSRTLFVELDLNRDNCFDFNEFISFYYIIFLKARCYRCNKCLVGKSRRTCVKCFVSRTDNNRTYDVCTTCYRFHRNTHHHDRSEFKEFEEVVFNGVVPTPLPIDVTGLRRTNSERLRIAFELGAAIGGPLVTVFAALAGCNIM